MHRECLQCHRAFTAQDFVKADTLEMETERKALGLQGVRFLYYSCPACSHADIFLDIHHLENETAEAFERRRADLEAAVRQVRGDNMAAVITER